MRTKTQNRSSKGSHRSIRSDRHAARTATRRRLTWIEWTAIMIIAAAILAVTVTSAPGQIALPTETTVVRVRESQTLWDIAQQCSPVGTPTAATVEYIKDLNSLEGSALAAGQLLEIPFESGEAAVAYDWK